MSLWDKMFSGNKAGNKNGGKSKRLYVVDASSLASSSGNKARLAPRVQLDMLDRLARFSKREGVRICMVFEDEPLRKVADKSDYKDINVRFAGRPSELPGLVIKVLKQNARRKEVVVITSDKKLEEQVINNGGETLRSSTFKKALESASGGEKKRSAEGGGRRRRPRRNGQRSGGQSSERKPAKEKKENSVRDLIDLVEEAPKPKPQVDPDEKTNGNIIPPPEPEPEDVNGNQ